LRLPDTGAKTAVNGQENFWLRVRLVKATTARRRATCSRIRHGRMTGSRSSPASFRPPIIAAIKLGYEITSRRSPRCLFRLQPAGLHGLHASGQGRGGPLRAVRLRFPWRSVPGSISASRLRPDERRFRTRRSALICAWPSPGNASALCRCRRNQARRISEAARR